MKVFVQNNSTSLKFALNIFALSGMWPPQGLGACGTILYNCYYYMYFMFITGIYVIVQTGDLLLVWGDIPLMTATFFLLFTNISLVIKMFNIMLRADHINALVTACDQELSNETREDGKAIIARYNKETKRQLYVYVFLTYNTILGWSLAAEKGQLPIRAWYPYDTTKTPAYQLTYTHQCIAVAIAAAVDIGTDIVVTSLVSQCRCRLRLLALSLRTLCDGFQVEERGLIKPEDEKEVYLRLRECVQRHQAVLEDARQLQDCFSIATFSQFTVTIFIICVTAYQLAFESKNIIGLLSMVSYIFTMMMQVFIYCYQGNQLLVESEAISVAAYECPWYSCSVGLRQALLVVMTRATRGVKLTAASLTDLSLATFVSIIKASYTFFTVLQGVMDVA